MKTNNKPSVLRSCSAAAHAAAAHAQEAANWADEAKTANAYALRASYAAERAAHEAAKTVRRLIIAATVATAFSALTLTVSIAALYHAA